MQYVFRVVLLSFIFAIFCGGANAHSKVVVIPMGDSGVSIAGTTMSPGDPNPVARGNYVVQCTLWNGNVCEEPLIRMDPAHITQQPHCVDAPDRLRPIWSAGNDVDHHAAVWCYIATGDSSVVSWGPGATEYRAGWMYTSTSAVEDCTTPDNNRRYSEVTVPNVGTPHTWSFDTTTYLRTGTWLSVECTGW